MKVQKVEKSEKGVKVIFTDEKQKKGRQRQAKLAALAEKKAKGELTLEDIDEKLNIVLEILFDMQP